MSELENLNFRNQAAAKVLADAKEAAAKVLASAKEAAAKVLAEAKDAAVKVLANVPNDQAQADPQESAVRATELVLAAATKASDIVLAAADKAAEALRRTEKSRYEINERNTAIIQTAMDGFFVIDLRGHLLEVNETFCLMTGYSQQELLTMSIPDLDSIETAEDAAVHIRKITMQGSDRFETRQRCKDGTSIDVEVSAQYRDIAGGLVVVFARDITKTKVMVGELKASEAWLRDMMANMTDWAWEVDANGLYTYIAPKGVEVLGVTCETVIGKSPFDFMPPREAKRVATIFAEIVAKKAPIKDLENWCIGQDNESVCLLTNGVPLLDEAGNLKGYRGVDKNITERKKAEQFLRESEELLREAQDIANLGSYELNIATGVWRCSEGMDRVFGIDPTYERSVAGWGNIIHPDERAMMLDYFNIEVIGHKQRFDKEYRIVRQNDQAIRWVHGMGKLGLDARGSILTMKGTIQDITERKLTEVKHEELESQLRQAHKMEAVGQLAGGVAHDFNNMLGVILGHAEMAMEQIDSSFSIYKDLTEIVKAAQRSADLTRQLLTFARKQVIAPKVIDVNMILAGAAKMLQRLTGENVSYILNPAANLWKIKMDPSQLEHVLANLCVNARDAITDIGNIVIETGNCTFDKEYCADHPLFVPGAFVRIAVSDNGCGMDQETLSRIFEPFYTTKGVGKGTGLGLAMVYGAVQQSNGFINVVSKLGQGATFELYLPRHTGEDGQENAQCAVKRSLSSAKTILLVEDEPGMLNLLKIMLEQQGHLVFAADTPRKAILTAKDYSGLIDLIITDVVMPEMNGVELVKQLLSLYPRLKYLFMSGYTANMIVQHGVLEDGIHLLQKPFSKEKLIAKMKEVFESK